MTRSGIKQGLAVSAVAALATVGLPAAAHAATVTYTVTPTAPSVSVLENDTIKIVPSDVSGIADGDAFGSDVTVTENAPSSTYTGVGAFGGSTQTNDAKWSETIDAADIQFVQTDGAYEFNVDSAVAGSVKLAFVANSTNYSTSFTVGGGQAGASNVSAVKASQSAFNLYQSDIATSTVSVRPVDGSGFGVEDVTVQGGITAADGTTTSTFNDSTDHAGNYDLDASALIQSIDDTKTGSYTLKFWVDKDTAGDVNGKLDADEKSVTVTVQVDKTPTATSFALEGVGGTDLDGAANALNNVFPSYAAAQAGAKVTVKNGTANVVGAKVRFDVYAAGVYQLSLSGVTDANGIASISAPISAAQAAKLAALESASGNVITVDAYISESTQQGVGATTTGYHQAGNVAEFQAPKNSIALQNGGTSLQATYGGTVNVPVVIADQFGKPAAGEVLSLAVNKNTLASAPTATTDANGKATLSYTDKWGSDTNKTETATVTDVSNAAKVTNTNAQFSVTVNYIAGTTAPAKVVLTDPNASATTTPVAVGTVAAGEGTTTYTLAADAVTNNKGEQLNGVPITVSVDNGFVSDATGTTAKDGKKSITVYSGTATTLYVGSTTAGTQTLTVSAGAASASAKAISYAPGAPYNLSVAPATASGKPGDTLNFTATVSDEFGNRIKPSADDKLAVSATGVGTVTTAYYVISPNGTANIPVSTSSTAGSGALNVQFAGTGAATSADTTSGLASTSFNIKDVATASFATAAVVAPPANNGGGSSTPTPAPKPAIGKVKGKSQGKKDVLTVRVAHANGKKVVVKSHGKKVGHGVVKNGKVVVKVADKNGKKKTAYQIVVAGVKKALKVA